MSDESSEEEEDEERWRQQEKLEQQKLLELQKKFGKQTQRTSNQNFEGIKESLVSEDQITSRLSTTVTRDTTSESRRSSSGKILASGAAERASRNSASSFDDSNIRPLPLPLASLSGNKLVSRRPKRPKTISADAAINAMNKAAAAAFSFVKPPPKPFFPTKSMLVTTPEKDLRSEKEPSLLEGKKIPNIENKREENYEDGYDEDEQESSEIENDSSGEVYDDDDDENLSLEGQHDLQKLKIITANGLGTASSPLRNHDEFADVDGGNAGETSEGFISSLERTLEARESVDNFKQLYSKSVVTGDTERENLEFSWTNNNKDGSREQKINTQQHKAIIESNVSFTASSSSTTEKQAVVEECSLKCNRGRCTREPSIESGLEQSMTGYRCLCPMGTKGTFCEIGEYHISILEHNLPREYISFKISFTTVVSPIPNTFPVL